MTINTYFVHTVTSIQLTVHNSQRTGRGLYRPISETNTFARGAFHDSLQRFMTAYSLQNVWHKVSHAFCIKLQRQPQKNTHEG